jgi:feruloyl-CoA synthase
VSSAPYRRVSLGDLTPVVDAQPNGSFLVRAREPLGEYPARFTDRLVHWARVAPDRTLLAWRTHDDSWARLTFKEALEASRQIGQALLDRGLSAERPLAILSGNSREHLLLALAAQHVGVPFVPISPAYSLLSTDFGTLRQAVALITAGLVFVDNLKAFAPALNAVLDPDTELVTAGDAQSRRRTTPFGTLLATAVTGEVDRAHHAVGPDTIAKILFTSGSTGRPKGVINTHRMLCSNQQMILQAFRFLGDEPPVLVDWLPWHHTFGGNHNIGIVVYNGGSLYLDRGRPMPGAFAESVRNLKEIAPTVYMNVPKGFEELVRALRADADLAHTFFQRVRCLFYAAASLSQTLAEALQTIAVETCGERLLLITGLGATELAPMAICRPWDDQRANAIGLPVPGLDLKLLPIGDRYEVRVSGPNVMPGFWRQDELTRDAFDDDGFYRMGDAVRFVAEGDPSKGLVFDGRLAEDFKMSSGTWVHVGPLRARVIAHFSPFIRDAVVTGHDRGELGLLAVPDLEACRTLCPDLPIDAPAAAILGHPSVRTRIERMLTEFAVAASGSATRILRLILLEEPPSLDAQETTDKGSLNQRAILKRRAALVEALHADMPPPNVIVANLEQWSPVNALPRGRVH